MAASNQRYTQLLDEYLRLKVSVSEALLGVYKKHPEILLDRTVYDYFQNELVFRFQQHLSSSQRVQLNINQNQMYSAYSYISYMFCVIDVYLKTNPIHGPIIDIFASVIDSFASIHSQLIKLEVLKDLIIAEELERLASIRKVLDDIDKLKQKSRQLTLDHSKRLAQMQILEEKIRVPQSKFTTTTHIPPNRTHRNNTSKAGKLSLSILASNCRSFTSKKKSIEQILIENSVDIAIVSELNMKTVPKIKGFFQFCNLSNRKFHGTAIFCQNHLQGQVIRIPDEDEIELVHILIKTTTPMLNLIGVYLDCEGRDNDVDKSSRIMHKLINKVQGIIDKGQSVLMLGDMNKNINHDNRSPATKILLDWLEKDTMKLLNNPSISTRIDPATGKGSTLDLAIVSSDIHINIKDFGIDHNREKTPFSIHRKNGDLYKKYTDHLSINVELSLPVIKPKKQKNVPYIDLNNKEGWTKYTEVSDKYADIVEEKVKTVKCINQLEAELQIIETEILIESFGIKWRKPSRKIKVRKNKKGKELREMINEDIIELDELLSKGYNCKDLSQKIYKLRETITGPKIKAQETMAINDPSTGELITDPEQIKEVSLQHNLKILTKEKPREEDKEEIKAKKANHDEIMKKNNKEWDLTYQHFSSVTAQIKKKGKKMFNPLIKAGEKYKWSIFKYMKRIIQTEEVPDAFNDTKLTAVYKGKGSRLDLNMMRFIHGRDWRSRLCDKIVTDKMKPDIVKACPNIQLGGIPEASSDDHLITLKQTMKNKEERKEGLIVNTYDMKKFFDKEDLTDALYTLNKVAKVDDQSYRIWYKMNQDTRISVKTSVGLSRSANVKDSLGQGSMGAALVSTINIGNAVQETFKEPSTEIGDLKLNSLVFQDDICKLSNRLLDSREGSEKIDDMLKRKLLSVNYDKSKYLVLGNSKFKNKIEQETSLNPMTMGGEILERTQKEKYLGDYIHEDGCEASIAETIKRRTASLVSKCEEIIQISESSIMAGLGTSTTAFRLYEAIIIPTLLHNAASWIGITDNNLKELQDFQNRFIRKVMRLPPSTPKAILEWDTELMNMKCRIWRMKIIKILRLMKKDNDYITKQAIEQEKVLGFNGLYHESKTACEELGMPDLLESNVSKQQIKQLCMEKSRTECKQKMLEGKKVRDRVDDDSEKSYLEYMTLQDSRIWIRIRARSIKGVKYNNKSSFKDSLNCRFCSEDIHETQEHLQECSGTWYERRNLSLEDSNNWKAVLQFWRRMTAKIAAVTRNGTSTKGIGSDRNVLSTQS